MTISHFGRELSEVVANRAQVTGWKAAIDWAAKEYAVKPLTISLLLDTAAEYNDKADPSGRIEELEDYVGERDHTHAPEELKDVSGSSTTFQSR